MRATLETIQARFDKLNQVVEQVAEKLRINAETAARNESELRQENTELVRRLDTVRLNTEAIAKDEQVRRKENAELARQLETVRLNTEKNENELRQENAEVIRRLDRVDHNTEAIAKNEYELRQENTELRVLAEAGFLRFAVRIDAEDFRAFAAIMLTGNRSQAAEALQIPLTTFWNKVETWPARGADYKRLYRMIEWRKKSGRRIKVRLDDSLLGTDVGEAENPQTIRDVLDSMRDKTETESRDDLLRDILQALVSQNAGNWEAVRAELIEILKEEIPQ